jgi:tRNA(Ile)-lysidine synthase
VDDPVKDVLDAARAAGMPVVPGPAVVLISGGRDSVCALDVAVTLGAPGAVRALHVNYRLRAESDEDERHVAALCAALGVELEVVRPQCPDAGRGNLQAWARDVRYAAASRLALRVGGVAMTGHTASDQVETVLYRLAASPGRRALLGMAPRDGRLLRPLLNVWRSQTTAYCRARGLTWREDASNASDRYARGRLRNGLAASLRELHPAAEANILRTAGLLRDEALVLDEVVGTALAGRDRIALSRLAELPPALARLVVIRLAEDAGAGPLPAVGGRLGELLSLGASGGSASLDVGGGVRAIVEYGVLRMSASEQEPAPAEVALEVPGNVRFGAWELSCEVVPSGQPMPVASSVGGADGVALGDVTEVVDAAALGERLRVRGWRHGDRMSPLGMRGSKTLADLFGERRLARELRHTTPVVIAGGAVVWVPGIALEERLRVHGGSGRTVRLGAHRV